MASDSKATSKIDANSFEGNRNTVTFWQELFELKHWEITCIAISSAQVIDDLHVGTCGHEFVGIAISHPNKRAQLYHTRPLLEDDLIHELLHVRFPQWSEEKVVATTTRFFKSSNPFLLYRNIISS